MKKRIVCFGDSLTWGYDPDKMVRFDESVRWTGVLQELLGDGYKVIEEGQNGRTIATDDPAKGFKNGLDYIIPCIESHKPFDVLIIMLGTNDIKSKFGYSAGDIAEEMKRMIEAVLGYNHFRLNDSVKVVLVSPPVIGENISTSRFGDKFSADNSREVSLGLADQYRRLAESYGIYFLDASEYVVTSDLDSIHMDRENQIRFGNVIHKYICDKVIR